MEEKKKRKPLRLVIFAVLGLLVICAVIATFTPQDDHQDNIVSVRTATAIPPTARPSVTMYVCGLERCKDNDYYGEMALATGINVWENYDPDRGKIKYKVNDGDAVTVVGELRVSDGPGGLWYELDTGGWLDDYFLTAERCTPGNIDKYAFTDCLAGEY